jgi:hypothetical protein
VVVVVMVAVVVMAAGVAMRGVVNVAAGFALVEVVEALMAAWEALALVVAEDLWVVAACWRC